MSPESIPPRYDLRRRGWLLEAIGAPDLDSPAGPVLVGAGARDGSTWVSQTERFPPGLAGKMLVLGIGDAALRAKLLNAGFGDVLGDRCHLDEIEARAARIAKTAEALPRSRMVGRLRLELIAREGYVDGKPLGLHPREFELIWRLAETPGVAIGKPELMNEVWRMSHVPDTNSIAVHVFRLRSKLGIAGLADMLHTAPAGGYFLAPPGDLPQVAA